jgi:hypothetical protein
MSEKGQKKKNLDDRKEEMNKVEAEKGVWKQKAER